MIAAGPREAERLVLAWVEAQRPRGVDALATPLLVVVPSRSLRRHLLAVLARELGALAGVEVLTHRALARRVVERAGEAPPRGARTHEILVRRFAAGRPGLREALGGLEDGYAVVAAAVRDLLDAGFVPETLDAAREAVEGARGRVGGPAVRRAVEVLEVAARCALAEREAGIPHRGTLLARAAALLGERGPDLLSRARVLVHGFAEATGLVTDLLEALVRSAGATVVVDHPPDPAAPGRRDAGWRFTGRLLDRLAGPGAGDRLAWPGPPAEGPGLAAFRAPGPEAEAREVAERVAALLEAGVPAERIGIVARRLDVPSLAVLRRQLHRLGVPFSGEGAAVPGGEAAARAVAVAELLQRGEAATVATWLAAARRVAGVGSPRLLELGLRSAGIVRLREVAAADVAGLARDGAMTLPVVERVEEDAATGEPVRRHLTVARPVLEAGRRAARELVELLARRPQRAPVGEHLTWCRRTLELLGWRPGGREGDPLQGALDRLEAELPPELEASWEELWPLLSRELRAAGSVPAGGEGGGVQLLSVMEARGRTFGHLFLVGVNRGVFPRQPGEDPVVPDAVRRALLPVLPEIPLKERGRIEDRHYFAQLLASAPTVTLSWCTVDADGAPRNPSAFVERLRLAGRLGEAPAVRDVFRRPTGEAPRPVLEHAVAAGLGEDREAMVRAVARGTGAPPEHLAAVLEELDPSRRRETPGPLLGLVGLAPPAAPWVTWLERFAACPWRLFLERLLGLVAPPEAAFAAEGVRGRLAGSVAHRVLERIALEAGVPPDGELGEVAARQPVRVPWPAGARLERLAAEAAAEVAGAEGVPALAPALARWALTLVGRAGGKDWPVGVREVLGVEVAGRCRLEMASGRIDLRFRTDRVDRGEHGLVLTDYKTGSRSGARTAATAVARGEAIQAAAYALAAGEGGAGRYLLLGDEPEERAVRREDAAGLPEVVEALLLAWATGWMPPRLQEPGGGSNRACSRCEVAEACLHGESGVRARLAAAMERLPGDDPRRRWWELPRARTRGVVG